MVLPGCDLHYLQFSKCSDPLTIKQGRVQTIFQKTSWYHCSHPFLRGPQYLGRDIIFSVLLKITSSDMLFRPRDGNASETADRGRHRAVRHVPPFNGRTRTRRKRNVSTDVMAYRHACSAGDGRVCHPTPEF